MKVCFDIDGVLADPRPFVTKFLPHDWDSYFERALEMEPIAPLISIFRGLSFQGHILYLVTGRPERNRELTGSWIRKNLNTSQVYPIFMRKNGDKRSTLELKLEWFRMLAPDLIIEDELSVVEAALGEGFTVLQVHGFRISSRDTIPLTKRGVKGEKENE